MPLNLKLIAPLFTLVFLVSAENVRALELVLHAEGSNPNQDGPVTAMITPPQADHVVPPSVGGQVSTIPINISCSFFGAAVPNCDITLNPLVVAEPNTGGHMHGDGGRPLGSIFPMQGNTGSQAYLATTYTAPEAAGVIRVSGSGTHPQYGFFSGTFTIGTMVSGLSPLGPSMTYDLVGQTAAHPDNHYGTPSFIASLGTLAYAYNQMFPGQKLAYNDMSLPWGGIFDIFANWGSPHRSHRLGTDVDVRLVPVNRRQALQHMIRQSGISTILIEGNHWHLRQ